jgi:hypothetical protein
LSESFFSVTLKQIPAMSLHSKKLEIIESILKVEEESVLYKVKSLIKKEAEGKKKKEKDMSEDDLAALLETSEKDYKNGKYITQAEAQKQVKKWRKK